jgi:hypothetical protein
MTEPQRAAALRACTALYGLAVAISLHDRFLDPAPAGQLPGIMTKLGYDAHSSFRFMATLVVLPLLFTWAARGAAQLLASSGGTGAPACPLSAQAWARNAYALACVAALWTVTLARDPVWVALPPALVMVAAVALRSVRANFSRRDVILLPVFASVFLALNDVVPLNFERVVILAVIATITLRLLLGSAFCFTFAPLALLLQSHFLGRNERYRGWPALAFIVITAVVLRFVRQTPRTRRRLRLALAWAIYPIACYAYLSAGSLYAAEGKVRVNVFEDAQHLVPATEIARGERAYRDIIPPHGLLQDGLLDLAFIRGNGGGNIGEVIKGRGTISGLIASAQYALGAAATGSAEGGILAFFLGAALGIGGGTFRAVPAMLTLAVILRAVRRRNPRLLAYAGAGVVASFLTSLDFGFYAGVALLTGVVLLARHLPPRRPLLAALTGGTAATFVAAIGLALFGIVGDFIRTTFFDIARWGPVYALTPFDMPAAMKTTHFIPDVLALALDRNVYLYLLFVAALVYLAAILTARQTTRRSEVMAVFAAFTVVCAVSYAERHHLHFQYGVPSLLAGALFALRRTRLHWPLLAIVLILAQPTTHLAIVGWLRHARGPIDANQRELTDPPRARNALFDAADAAMITSVQKYVSQNLNPEETFVDFTNRGLLYYLTNRDCPLRQLEVAFYEPESRQREVIAAIEHNPRIRAALVPPPDGDTTGVDGVDNPTRAPLVWKYLQAHFEPAFREGGVVFWRRK